MKNIAEFLTPKQKHFCDEYLIDRNATRAALRAGYSASTALNGQLMRMPKISLYLQQQTEVAAQRAQVSHDMVLRELCKIAFANMGNYFGADGALKPMHELNDDEKAALWIVTKGKDSTDTKIKLYNKLTALDKIAKHINFYKPEVKQPEVKYVYLDKEDMTEDDWFEEELDEEFEEESQELRSRNQEVKAKKDYAGVPLDNGNVVFIDSAGIAYQKESEPVTADADVSIKSVKTTTYSEAVSAAYFGVAPLSGKFIPGEVRKERKAEARYWRG